MDIRFARPSDAAAIADVYAPIVRDTVISFETQPPDETEIRSRIISTLATHPWLVGESGSRLLGYAYASQHRTRAAYRWSCDVAVYVHAEARGQRVGKRLYTALFPMLEAQGFRSAFAGITLPNVASIALHESTGFRHLGTYANVGFKLGAWRDVGWWQRDLSVADGTPADPLTPLKAGLTD